MRVCVPMRLCVPWRPWRCYPPIDTDLHRLKKKTTEDTEIYREHRKRGIEVLRDWGVESLSRWGVGRGEKPQRTQKFTEDTEKTFPCVIYISLRLCVAFFAPLRYPWRPLCPWRPWRLFFALSAPLGRGDASPLLCVFAFPLASFVSLATLAS